MLLRIVNTAVMLIFVVTVSSHVISCSAENSTTTGQSSKTVQIQSGKGKDELLKWFANNFKYASLKGFMEKREEQINSCMEKKIECKWIIGSEITNSKKGYIVSFRDNEFTVDEFPAGSESEYVISNKDIYFRTK